MCGLVGFIDNSKNFSFEENSVYLKKMGESINHRGPDYSGNYKKNNIFLWHNRLSIQDISSKGNQPMCTNDGNEILLFNGEVYNHYYLREIINNKFSYNWKSSSDTETLLMFIHYFGISLTLKKISGMFSISYLNIKENKIYLIRDRFGEKPLYYSIDHNLLFFSSELKALRYHPKFKKEINNQSLKNYFAYGYVPAPLSIYENTYKVEPATIVEINIDTLKHDTYKYWNIESNKYSKNFNLTDNEIKINTKALLKNSIKEQLISDVPLGCFLSGGVDSSLITALTQEISTNSLKTFSIGFENNFYDESKYSSNIANFLGTEHYDIRLKNTDIANAAQDMGDIYCEPFSDSSQLPTLLLSKFAKQYVKVCLSGDGGDEMFLGYNRYLYSEIYFNKILKIPQIFRIFLSYLLLSINSETYNKGYNILQKINLVSTRFEIGELIHKFANALKINDLDKLYNFFISTFQNLNILNKKIDRNYILAQTNKINNTTDMNLEDFKFYLPEDILCKVDRASMSTSLETRMPFLNRELFEFLINIDINKKLKHNKLKYISKSILYDYIPTNNFNNQKKGFSIALDSLIRNELKEFCYDTINSNSNEIKNFIDFDYLQQILSNHFRHSKNFGKEIWNAVIFIKWYNSQ